MDHPPRIGPYPVERLLGAGAMGSVFLARHPETQAPLAIKVLHEHDPELIARFAREAEVMARIQDPRVVRALDAGLHEGEPYLVLEYCPGEDLAAVLKKRGALEPREAAQLVAEIGRGLAAAHAVGVLHRDLKPANVLLDPEGKPKVGDFGLARVDKAPGVESLTQSGVILGTPAYMAPEQMHDARRVDARSDVYALGAILYECLGGKRPFGTGNALAIMQRAIEAELEPLPSELPQELLEVVTCAMALDPADRFSEASLLVEALEEALDSAPEGRSSGARRVGGVFALIAVAVGLAVGLAAGVQASSAPSSPTASRQTTPLVVAPSRPQGTTSPSSSRSPVTTPSPSPTPTPGTKPREYFETQSYFAARRRFWRASLKEVRAAAEAGEIAALTQLGDRLLNGRGVKRDKREGLATTLRAAKAGDPAAMMLLVRFYGGGASSSKWLDRAAAVGFPQALVARALMSKGRQGVEGAAVAARKQLAAGDPAAFQALAIYANYSGNFALAKEAAARGAELGVPGAHAMRGRLARARGQGQSEAVLKDFRTAASSYDPAGLCGQARWLLDQQEPTPQERALAEELLKEAEDTGYAGAKLERLLQLWRAKRTEDWIKRVQSVARLPRGALPAYLWGELGVHLSEAVLTLSKERQQDLKPIALAVMRRARPEQSLDPRVCYARALQIYASPMTHARALLLFKRAAEEGHIESSHAWGAALCAGDSVEKNVPLGLSFLERAGAAGHHLSWRWLGDLYREGRTLPRDLDKALGYYLAAAKDPNRSPALCGKIAITLTALNRRAESREWAEQAAKGGDPAGTECLGRLLVLKGVPKEVERGLGLLKRMADHRQVKVDQTMILAARFLSNCYERGLGGVTPDPERAAHYRSRAKKLRSELKAAGER